MIRVLIVDAAPHTRANIGRAVEAGLDMSVVGEAGDRVSAVAQSRELRPDVVLMDIDLPEGDGLKATQMITEANPDIAVILMGLDDDDGTLRLVTDAGARQYLVKPFGGDELIRIIHETVSNGPRAPIPDSAPDPSPAVAQPYPPSAPTGLPVGQAIHTIAVVAGKGGVGTTMLATSIALIARNEAHLRTALVDLDLQHGDIRRLLRIESRESIIELAMDAPQPDEHELMRRFVEGPAGVMTLTAPARPRIDVELTEDFAQSLMYSLRAISDIAVIDLPAYITPASAAVLRSADRVVLVSSMSDPGVRSTHGMLSLFGDLGIPRDRVVLVLNRNEANSDLTKAAVEEALGIPVAVQLPYDFVLVSTAMNRGVPFVLQKPDAQVSRKVRELAGALFPLPFRADPEEPVERARTADLGREDTRENRRPRRKGLFGFGKEA